MTKKEGATHQILTGNAESRFFCSDAEVMKKSYIKLLYSIIKYIKNFTYVDDFEGHNLYGSWDPMSAFFWLDQNILRQ